MIDLDERMAEDYLNYILKETPSADAIVAKYEINPDFDGSLLSALLRKYAEVSR